MVSLLASGFPFAGAPFTGPSKDMSWGGVKPRTQNPKPES